MDTKIHVYKGAIIEFYGTQYKVTKASQDWGYDNGYHSEELKFHKTIDPSIKYSLYNFHSPSGGTESDHEEAADFAKGSVCIGCVGKKMYLYVQQPKK